MSELLGITVEDLVATATQRRARIPSEIGAFVALEAAEALAEGPASVRASDVRIADDGTISVFAPPNSATSDDAARAVVAMLSELLAASGTGVPRALVTLVEQGPSSGRWDLGSLRDDLEASLVPLNRAAARRVLSRMLRDVRRPRVETVTPPPPPPDDGTLDAQLDALLDSEDLAPPPRSADDLDAELDATISELDAPDVAPVARSYAPRPIERAPEPIAPEPIAPERIAPRPLRAQPVAERPSAPIERAPEPDDVTLQDHDAPPARLDRGAERSAGSPEVARRGRDAVAPRSELDDRSEQLETLGGELDRPRKRGGSLGWILAFLALLTATAAALAVMRPDLVDRALGRPAPPPPDPGPTEEDRERMLREHRARFGTLVVTGAPSRAQVLMYVGRGPALATDLPLGVALEFVAVADGRTPTRAVVPPDASWDEVEGRPRYELAMQAGSAPMAELALGPTTLPQDVGAPSGSLGDVRVITNPPGAKVYVVVGFAPSVSVENVRTDEAVELLVYSEGAPVQRVVVGPSDWVESADGGKRAEVSVPAPAPEPPRRR